MIHHAARALEDLAGALCYDSAMPLTVIQRRIVEAGAALRSGSDDEISYQHSILCQVGLPMRKPDSATRIWERRQGAASLRVEAGAAIDSNGTYVEVALPSAEKARLVLIHLISEAIRGQSPEIEVAGSLTGFVASLGLPTSGRQIRTVREQLTCLSTATIRLGWVDRDGRAHQSQGHIVEHLDLWAPDHPGQRSLWPSSIRLSDQFFRSTLRHAVPLSPRAVGALAHSALALDVYCWLAHRLHRLDQPVTLHWSLVRDQFGPNWREVRFFRRKFVATLAAVLTVYPAAQVAVTEAGLILRPSPPPILPRAQKRLV